jgi:hypothetical protein
LKYYAFSAFGALPGLRTQWESSVLSSDSRKIPDAAKRGGIRRSHDAGGRRGDGVPGGGVLFARRGLAGGEQEKAGGGNAYHIVGFWKKVGKTMPACLGNPYPEIPI